LQIGPKLERQVVLKCAVTPFTFCKGKKAKAKRQRQKGKGKKAKAKRQRQKPRKSKGKNLSEVIETKNKQAVFTKQDFPDLYPTIHAMQKETALNLSHLQKENKRKHRLAC
jgi:hypothetical protein